MNGLLIAFEIVLLVPLFVATWRTSLLGLAAQGALMSAIVFRHGVHPSMSTAVEIIDLVVLRTIIAPIAIYLVLREQNAPRRNDVIAPNLFSWAIALSLVLVSFRLADVLVSAEGDPRTLVAVSTSAILIGLLVLSTRSRPLSQMIGVLRLENGIALFQIGSPHRGGLGMEIAQTLVFACSIGLIRWYLAHLHTEPVPPAGVEKVAL
jgi:hydrogenase-4 component E